MSRDKKNIDLRHELRFKRNLNQLDLHYKKIIELEEEIRFHRAEIDKLVGMNQKEKFGESTDELMLLKRFERIERCIEKLDSRLNSLRPITTAETGHKYARVEASQRDDFNDDREILVQKLREQIEAANRGGDDSEDEVAAKPTKKQNMRKPTQRIMTHVSDDDDFSEDDDVVYEGNDQKYVLE